MSSSTRSLSLAAFMVAAGCAGHADESPDGAGEVSPSQVGPEEDLGAGPDAGRAFRPSGPGFRTEGATHDAVVVDGAIRVTPYHWDGAGTVTSAPVTFSTISMSRGDLAIDVTAGEAAVADGVVEIARGAITETVSSTDDSLEQSWLFPTAPDGDADLLVAVHVEGHASVSTTDSGLHFFSDDGLGFRYSNAYWIDASGTSWNVPVEWDGSEIAMRVPAAVLEKSTYPAVLDPIIGAEQAIDSPAYGFTGARALQPAIAWSGTSSLVVWRDDRSGSDGNIWGARVADDGTLLDPGGILIGGAELKQTDPAVTWTGSTWVVAWTHDHQDIAAATVSSSGQVSPLGFVAATGAVETTPALGSNGSSALLVWQSDADLAGAVFDGAAFGVPFTVNDSTTAALEHSVAGATGGDYLVTWHDGELNKENIRGQLVSGGAPSGGVIAVSTAIGSQTVPAVAYNGTSFVVAWRNAADIWATRVSTAGAVLDLTDGVGGVVISASPTNETNPDVACDAASCLIGWQDRRDDVNRTYGVYGRRVGFDLGLLGSEIVISDETRNQIRLSLARRANGFSTVNEDEQTGVAVAMLVRIDAAGGVLDPTGIVLNRSSLHAQYSPAYGRSAGGHIALWADSATFGDDIKARRYDRLGARLPTEAVTVSGAEHTQNAPSVDFDGSNFLVAWSDARGGVDFDIYAARMGNDGVVDDPAGIPISTAERHQLFPDVTSGGDVSLVTWQSRNAANDFDVMGAIVSTGGAVTVGDIPICETTGHQQRAVAAWDPFGSVFVVAWSDTRAGEENADIYAARVTSDGTVLDPCGVQVSSAPTNETGAEIAYAGGQLLIVWRDDGADLSGDVYGSVVNTADALNVGAPLPIAVGPGAQAQATIVGLQDGSWGVVWVDDTNLATTGLDLWGNEVLPGGTLLGAQYVVSRGTFSETAPSFQSGLNVKAKRVYLVYERRRLDLGTVRVVRRSLTN